MSARARAAAAPGRLGVVGVLGLAALGARRTLAPALALGLLALLVFTVTRDWRLPAALVPEAPPLLARALARQTVWTVLLALALPVLIARAAGELARWRRDEAGFVLALPVARATPVVATFAGAWAATLLVLAAIACGAELAAARAPGDAAPALRPARSFAEPARILFPGEAALSFTLADPALGAAGARLRLHAAAAPGAGPAATVALALTAAGGATAERSFVVAARRALELTLPAGAEAGVRVTLRHLAGRAPVVLGAESVELLLPATSDRHATLTLLARTATASLAWIALALGLGAWMRPALAALSVGALWLLPWALGAGSAVLPGGDLPAALGALGEGLVPAPARAEPVAVAAALALVGLALGARGLRGGRSGA